jgi:hypothetical protein
MRAELFVGFMDHTWVDSIYVEVPDELVDAEGNWELEKIDEAVRKAFAEDEQYGKWVDVAFIGIYNFPVEEEGDEEEVEEFNIH